VRWDLEGVADAVVDDVRTLFLDDLSTPGAYWLNTMVPVAPGGGPADPDSPSPLPGGETGGAENWGSGGAGSLRANGDVKGRSACSEGAAAAPSGDGQDAEMRRILADLDAL
jgi:hypothetical protein